MELASTSNSRGRVEDTDEPPTARALLTALGCVEDSPQVREFLLAVGVSECALCSNDRKVFPPDCEYVNYRAHGVSLCFLNGRCDTVHVYAPGADGFDGYVGELPMGVRIDSSAVDVVRELGEPTCKGGAGRMIFLSYDHLGLKFDVSASTWDEPTAKVRSVAVWNTN